MKNHDVLEQGRVLDARLEDTLRTVCHLSCDEVSRMVL